MPMAKILTHCFYNAPDQFSSLAYAVGMRASVQALSPLVVELASLYKEAPTEELEQYILESINHLGKKYDE